MVIAALGLFMWSRDGGALRNHTTAALSAADAGHRFPAYSADGSRIVFRRRTPPASSRSGSETSPVETQFNSRTRPVPASRPRWLSDDRVLYGVAGQGLWVVSALGGTPTRLIERGANPDVSRDGRRIVFEARAGIEPALWTAASDGSDVRQISGTAPHLLRRSDGPRTLA